LSLDPKGRARQAAALSEKARKIAPEPARVRYNDWHRVRLPASDAFEPVLPVTVIIPSYQPEPGVLATTLAALERQTYPKELLEVVIVDDGSDPPVEVPAPTLTNVTIVRQERRGFGIARARNTGVRASSHAHGVAVFLDGDIIAEAELVAGHARWHHFVSNAVTAGHCGAVSPDGITADAIRGWDRSLAELAAFLPKRGTPAILLSCGLSLPATFASSGGGRSTGNLYARCTEPNHFTR